MKTILGKWGGGGTRSLAPDCDSALRHSELVSESLNKGKDSGSEAGMTNKKCSSLCPEVRSDEGSRTPCPTCRHSDENQSLSMPINLVWHSCMQKSRKAAFTMAEVLITLGIIGIIAAMTLPNLIGNYKMLTYEVAFKKQYALLQNTMNLLTVENGTNRCYTYFPSGSISYQIFTDDCEFFEQELVKKLDLHKLNNEDFKDKYAKRDEALAQGGQAINTGCSYDNFLYGSTPYFSNDGAIFMFQRQWLFLDVNGEKGPNRWGYDLFMLGWSNHNKYEDASSNLLLTDEFCSLIEKGGKFPRTILRNQEGNSDTKYYW